MVNVADLNFLDDEEIDQEAYSVIDIKMAPEFDELNGQDNLALVKVYTPFKFCHYTYIYIYIYFFS